MHITQKISEMQGETLISFEILPPVLRRDDLSQLFDLVKELMNMDPAFINITYHSRQQKKIIKRGDQYVLAPVRKRPGTVGICTAVKNRFKIETVPHLTCNDHNIHEIEDKLIELNYLGIDNILVLRGDKLKYQESFSPEPGGHYYAIDLLKQVVDMNQGSYIENHPGKYGKTNFCIGVAGYPEKHLESESYKQDLQYLKQKIDAGAHYVVTQMFFDNEYYFKFVDDCRKIGITVPIIPGIKNLTKASQLGIIRETFGVTIPQKLAQAFSQAKSQEEEATIGTDWCTQQSLELKKNKVPVIHYYTMGKIEYIKVIIKEVFPEKFAKTSISY